MNVAILEQPVIEKILAHLGLTAQPSPKGRAREAGQDFAAWAEPHFGNASSRDTLPERRRGGAARHVSARLPKSGFTPRQ